MRPKLLSACLTSIAAQRGDDEFTIHIIVVDNDPAGSAAPVVAEFKPDFPVTCIHQPRRGIAIARNAALDAAKAIGADWIAFIDDDETAAPDWLENLMAKEYRDTPVLMGRQIMVYPPDAPFWTPRERRKRPEEGRAMTTAYTHNVRLSAALVDAGLRFDESLGAMGGEDQEFFAEAYRRGFTIRRTERALTYETAHRERLTYVGQVYRAYWTAASNLRHEALLNGWARCNIRKAHTVPINIIFGLFEIAASPIFLVGGLVAFKSRAVGGGKKIAKGLGRAAGILGIMPQPYVQVVGE
jgi:succinoglycan biosynthesis protein ExoM